MDPNTHVETAESRHQDVPEVCGFAFRVGALRFHNLCHELLPEHAIVTYNDSPASWGLQSGVRASDGNSSDWYLARTIFKWHLHGSKLGTDGGWGFGTTSPMREQ